MFMYAAIRVLQMLVGASPDLTFHVHPLAGDDTANAGTDATKPFRTIQRALEVRTSMP